MRFGEPTELIEWYRGVLSASEPMRQRLALETGIDACYYEGCQWINDTSGRAGVSTIGRRMLEWSPDSPRLRVQANRTTINAVRAISYTWPESLDGTVQCPSLRSGVSGQATARALEAAVAAAVGESGLVSAARIANARRSIMGDYVVGLRMRRGVREMDGQPSETMSIEAFTAEPSRLVLDPANPSPDLRDHDYVGLVTVMTAERARRVYGADLRDEELSTIGQITPMHQSVAQLSSGRVYAEYQRHSGTKGVLVHEVWIRNADRVFDRMYVLLQRSGDADGFEVIGFEDASTPFGGDGLPLVKIGAHPRPDAPWSIGDVRMMRDDQNKANLLDTFIFRQIMKSAGFQWLVDKRSIPRGSSDQEFRNQFTNSVAGAVFYEGRRRDESVPPPQLVRYPDPSAAVEMMRERVEDKQREQALRSETTIGRVKSHVTAAAYDQSIEQADQPLGVRATTDAEAYGQLQSVLMYTLVRHARRREPGTLGMLVRSGLEPADLGAIASVHPVHGEFRVSVSQARLRYRPYAAKRADADFALLNGALDPRAWRDRMAQLETPISDTDAVMRRESLQLAMRVAGGEPFAPQDLGEHEPVFIDALLRAKFDRRITAVPGAAERLEAAIAAQREFTTRRAAELAALASGQTATAAAPQPPAPEMVTAADLLGGGPGLVGGQPPAAFG